MNGFARRLVLIHRQQATWECLYGAVLSTELDVLFVWWKEESKENSKGFVELPNLKIGT